MGRRPPACQYPATQWSRCFGAPESRRLPACTGPGPHSSAAAGGPLPWGPPLSRSQVGRLHTSSTRTCPLQGSGQAHTSRACAQRAPHTGTFSDWAGEVPLRRSSETADFYVCVPLPPGLHQVRSLHQPLQAGLASDT